MGTLYVCLFWYPKWLTKEIICKYINIFLNISMPFLPRVSCIPLNSSIAERQASSSSHCFAPFHKVREIKCCQMKVDQLYFRPLEKNLHADMQLLQIWLINLLTAKLIFQLSCYQTCTGMEGTVSYCEFSSPCIYIHFCVCFMLLCICELLHWCFCRASEEAWTVF